MATPSTLLRFLQTREGMGLAGAPGGYSRAEGASDPKESVCYDALFEGDSSKDVIKEIKTKCDKNGVLSKLDGSGGSGGKSMLLLELEAHIQKDNTKKDSESEIPAWFKAMVTKSSSQLLTQRVSCLGQELMPPDIEAAEEAISCLTTEFGSKVGGVQQPMSKDECLDVIQAVDNVVNQRLRLMAASVGTSIAER